MRKTLLLSSLLLLCGLWVMAQTSPSSSQTSPSSSSTSSQSSTSNQSSSSTMGQSSTSEHHTKVKGCLNGSSGNYTLTDKSGKSWQLSGDTSKLSEHVGHTVEITGTKSSPTTGSSASTSSGAGTSSTETLDVTSVKHISPTCSSGSSSGMSK